MSNLLRKIRTAPYRTIERLSADVASNLGSAYPSSSAVAEALVHAAEQPSQFSDEDIQEAEILLAMFSRKRAVTIQRHGDGFKIGGATFAEVACTDIREGLMEFLDANITLSVLRR